MDIRQTGHTTRLFPPKGLSTKKPPRMTGRLFENVNLSGRLAAAANHYVAKTEQTGKQCVAGGLGDHCDGDAASR
ncbi:Unannotated [Lentimonas sp. CC4]|nr:Unannotated [Lentimonas sp. CC4]CAA6684938.1 Unannotated [Lentimonas sp. CC6]CAA7077950.1 Unannotated [Lentimonas sp. CC4]CAA7169871.1 Unannotated [Lentimonas sp. CC21]CAA7181473.1 Unannotated [Lentimonas sp. CC8]